MWDTEYDTNNQSVLYWFTTVIQLCHMISLLINYSFNSD